LIQAKQKNPVFLIFFLAVCGTVGCINPPSGLVKTVDDGGVCGLKWTDNSDNEDGFNIYIGGSCADCNKTTNWTKLISANKASYNWSKSCCQLGECSCAMVRAYNAQEESANSNIVMLAPVC
jgi:hypothetical protein